MWHVPSKGSPFCPVSISNYKLARDSTFRYGAVLYLRGPPGYNPWAEQMSSFTPVILRFVQPPALWLACCQQAGGLASPTWQPHLAGGLASPNWQYVWRTALAASMQPPAGYHQRCRLALPCACSSAVRERLQLLRIRCKSYEPVAALCTVQQPIVGSSCEGVSAAGEGVVLSLMWRPRLVLQIRQCMVASSRPSHFLLPTMPTSWVD